VSDIGGSSKPVSLMIVVAHSSKSRGVSTPTAGFDEYEVSKRASLALMRALMDDYEVELYSVGAVQGAGKYLPRKIEKINGCKPSLAIEIHCNGGPPSANYREVIFWPGSEKGEAAAKHIASALDTGFPTWPKTKARANHPNLDLHWMYFLQQAKVPSLIIEGLFLSNPMQRNYIQGVGAEQYGLAIADGVRKFLDELQAE
jgi:hypothetical protein